MDSLFLSVLNMSLVGGLVIIAIVLARLPLKKVPKIFSYCLWLVAAFRLVVPYSWDSVFGIIPPIGEVVSRGDLVIYIFSGVWFVGFMFFTTFGILSYFRLETQMEDAEYIGGNVYRANIASPFVLGLFNPRIYIPTDVSEDMLECIIFHEEVHIRRKDYLVKFFAYFILCLHWFNPLVWLGFVLMETDMEMGCDEYVLKHMGEGLAQDYARVLVELATDKRRIIAISPLAFGEGGVKERVKNVLKFKKASRVLVAASVVIVLVLGVGLGFDNRPRYELLILNMHHVELVPISNELTNSGIRNRLVRNGTGLEVDSRKLIEARELVITHHLSFSPFTWANAFDGTLTITDATRHTMAVLATSAEIEQQLMQFEAISYAHVTLNIPEIKISQEFTPFSPAYPSASATLFVTKELSYEEGRDIALAITRMVNGLELKNVAIIDHHARIVFNEEKGKVYNFID